VVMQIEKSTGSIITVTCERKWMENSPNGALHDHSFDVSAGRLTPVMSEVIMTVHM